MGDEMAEELSVCEVSPFILSVTIRLCRPGAMVEGVEVQVSECLQY